MFPRLEVLPVLYVHADMLARIHQTSPRLQKRLRESEGRLCAVDAAIRILLAGEDGV